MEFLTGKHLDRRTFVKGMGTSVALPLRAQLMLHHDARRAERRHLTLLRRHDCTGALHARNLSALSRRKM